MAKQIKSNFNKHSAKRIDLTGEFEYQTGELESIKELSKKEQWFKENWISISKTQHGIVIDLNHDEK